MSKNVEQLVRDTVLEIAQQRSVAVAAVSSNQLLAADLGFDSLDLAQLVSTLEIRLGVDPFATQSVRDVRTVADLCDVYRKYHRESSR